MTQLVNDGRVHRSQLGVGVQGVTSDVAASLGLKDVGGALVSSVTKGSAADKAGVERGDVIVSIDGTPVTDGNMLRNRVASAKPGSSVSLGLVRDGRDTSVRARLQELPEARVARAKGGNAEGCRLGLSARPLTPEDARELGLDA